jgi:tetratricopeptide (TPR) repeat protein
LIYKRIFIASTLIILPFSNLSFALQPEPVAIIAASNAQSRNVIEGRITTVNNQPLESVRVLLLDGGYSQIGMTVTDSIGRYRFQNLSTGEYYIQAEPVGKELQPDTQRITVNPFSARRGAAEIFRLDIALRPKDNPNRNERASAGAGNGTLFYQNVPEEAKKEYARSVKSLEKDEPAKATISLKRALEIFPDYYEALELLGCEYVKQREYALAVPLLMRATKVNNDNWRSHYSLGVALVELKRWQEGVPALRRAVELNPDSANTNMRLGIALAQDPASQSEAIQRLNKVKEIAGKQIPDVYLYLASLYSKSNQYREAADLLEIYLETIPADQQQSEQRDKMKKVIENLRQKAAQSQPKS